MLPPIEELTRALSRLPGFGRRSAGRAALALVREPELLADPLVAALAGARSEVTCCSQCGSFTIKNANPCVYCTDLTRDEQIMCVVEDPSDVVTIESSGAFHGKYHVLGGKLDPMKGLGPEHLRLMELRERIGREKIGELLLALSTDLEGDATAGYIAEMLGAFPIKISRLAFGLPADSGVSYSDPITLKRAILHRVTL